MSPRRVDESVGVRTEVVGRTQLMHKAGLTHNARNLGKLGFVAVSFFPS
jgi:hypothetical protein